MPPLEWLSVLTESRMGACIVVTHADVDHRVARILGWACMRHAEVTRSCRRQHGDNQKPAKIDSKTPKDSDEATSWSIHSGFRIWVRFDDETEGEVELSDLAGNGVFRAWEDRKLFEAVFVGPPGSIAWPDGIELCPDSTYLRLTGLDPEDLFPKLKASSALSS